MAGPSHARTAGMAAENTEETAAEGTVDGTVEETMAETMAETTAVISAVISAVTAAEMAGRAVTFMLSGSPPLVRDLREMGITTGRRHHPDPMLTRHNSPQAIHAHRCFHSRGQLPRPTNGQHRRVRGSEHLDYRNLGHARTASGRRTGGCRSRLPMQSPLVPRTRSRGGQMITACLPHYPTPEACRQHRTGTPEGRRRRPRRLPRRARARSYRKLC